MQIDSREAPTGADRPLAELLRELAAQLSVLVRQEIALARAEATERLKALQRPALMLVVALVLLTGAFAAFTTMLIGAFALALPLWGAALIVALLYGAIAGMAALRARSMLRKARSSAVPQTIANLRQDVETIRLSIRRGR